MEILCPSCRSRIPADDLNVSTDIALCRACDKPFRISEAVGSAPADPQLLATPPSGAWFDPLPDGFRAGASTRSWMALFIVPFTCVWSGGSLFGIYGTQIVHGRFNVGMSLFGLPFLLGSMFLISWCLMSVAGSVRITRHGDQLSIFTGVGPIGWTRQFAWSDFKSVRELSQWNTNNWNRQGQFIVLEGKRRVTFGSMLSTGQRYFLVNALRSALSGTTPSAIYAGSGPRFR